jgi:rhodanese-related sulfurtransferase
MKQLLTILSVLLAALLLAGFRWSLLFGELQWQDIDQALDQDFPAVRHLGVEELRTMLAADRQLVLVDVREQEEYQVSHLPKALPARVLQTAEFDRNQLIVAYCSVGLRSAEYVQQLQQQGFRNVYNLRGSIFMWANNGYPLEADGTAATKVHPYNDRWGKLLHPKLRSTKGEQ